MRRDGEGRVRKLGGPDLGLGCAADLEDALGDRVEIFDRGGGPAGHADHAAILERGRVVQVPNRFDLEGRRPGDAAQPSQLLRVRRRTPSDDDHQVDLARRIERVLLAPDRDRTDGVDDLELVAPSHHERGQLLELPGRLGTLRDQGHPLPGRDLGPVVFLIDHDRVGGEAEEPDDLRVLRCAEEHDGVTLLDEAAELSLFLDDPGARPVDDLEAALGGTLHDLGPDTVGTDDHRGPVIDIVERIHGSNAERLQVPDDAFVVHDLAEGVRRLARGTRLLGLVDGLAYAIAKAGALRDSDIGNGSHTSRVSHGCPGRPSAGRS